MSNDFDVKLLFDGNCPLCRREWAFIKRRDRRNRVAGEDIAAAGFDASRFGRTQEQVMARIHGVLPDGTVIEGVEVFRRAYRAIGLGWLIGWTAWPVFRPIADAGYRWFARNRMRLTFRKHDCVDACTPRV